MNQSLSPISDPRNESVEVSRRLYRSLMETARQLDDLRRYAKTTRDLFSVQAQLLRTKLREIAERLIFSTLAQCHKIEEILWRKGFYEDVSSAKQLRKDNQWLPEERVQLTLHLKCGIGFYHHLLLCLQTEYGILSGCIDFPMIFSDQDFVRSKLPATSSKQLETARESVHRCLVCLGDLNRYLMDIPPCFENDMAYRYYHQALSWNPDVGMPHNQLGTLSLSVNCNLDAVYHYMRCLMCSQSFEGAERNLKRSFERNSQIVAHEKSINSGSVLWRCNCSEPGTGQLTESQDHVQRFVAHFLLLADVWFFDKKPVPNISDLCHQILLDFGQCLCLVEPPHSDSDCPDFAVRLFRPRENFPSYLCKDMILKIVVITLMCLTKLKHKGSDQVSSVVAFILAIFCLLIQQVQQHFEDSVLNLSLPTVKEEDNVASEVKVNGHHCDEKIASNGEENLKVNGLSEESDTPVKMNGDSKVGVHSKKPKRRKRIVRRRHRQLGSDNSDQSDGEESDILSVTSDGSDDEEVVLDLSSDDEEVPENSSLLDNNDEDVVILEEVNESDEAALSKKFVNGHNINYFKLRSVSLKVSNPVDVLEQVAGEGLLPAIKVCADWLQGETAVIAACGRDSLHMLKCFVDLINVINIDLKELEKDPDASIFLKHRSLIESDCKLPLPEDAQLQKLPFLDKAHSSLDWEMIRQYRLTSKEEALLRIHKLVLFCHSLESVPETGVKYNNEDCSFSVCAQSKLDKLSIPKSGHPVVDCVDQQKKREEVMHSMGQLWLRAEVQNLKTSVKIGNKGATFSPYLVLDVDALTKYYHMVGQLMASRKFIMVVPSVVLTALDQLKRESVLARDAIRWLEFQFQKGSRFLRAQTTSEALHLPLVSYPKQKSREAWTYFKVLECCHYLNNQSSLSKSKGSDGGFVTLLTGHSWTDGNEFSPVGVAKAVGISVEHIESFFAKWKTSSKSHG